MFHDKFRCLVLLAALACYAGVANAQAPGSVDPDWSVVHQEPAPAGARSWSMIATQPSGQLLVSGNALNEQTSYSAIWRYGPDGHLDTSFADAGTFYLPSGMGSASITVDGTGRIYLLSGTSTSSLVDGRWFVETGFAIFRLQANGTRDTSFGDAGFVRIPVSAYYTNDYGPQYDETWLEHRFSLIPFPGMLRLQPDGRILLIGQGKEKDRPQFETVIAVARLHENGLLDSGFGTNGMTFARFDWNLNLGGAVVMNDGAFVVAATEYPGPNLGRAHLRKWNPQGAVDTAFGTNGAVVLDDAGISDLELQPDGKLLYSGTQSGAYVIGRLDANGTRDLDFGSAGYAVHDLKGFTDIALEPGGGILVPAFSVDSMGERQPFLARLTADGIVDSGFVRTPIDDAAITALAVGQGAFLISITSYPELNYSTRRNLRKFMLEPWPRTGSVTTEQTASASSFRIEARNLGGILVDTATTAHVLGLHGYIFPENPNPDVRADVFVVVATSSGWFMRNSAGDFVPWSTDVADLVPAYDDVLVTEMMYAPIYAGQLPFTGAYQLYLGYRRNDGGPLIYIDEPTTVEIAQ